MYKNHIVVDFEMNPVAKGNREIRQVLKKEIIEIGAIMLNEKHEVVDRFVCYVCPKYNSKVTKYITNLTGIKTTDVYRANTFEVAVKNLNQWIGRKEGTRIYSWSNSDLEQLKEECAFKEVDYPENMNRWIDLQAVYPRIMRYPEKNRRYALKIAAEQLGIGIDTTKVHSALYDAEITSELLVSILRGNYYKQIELLQETTVEETQPMTQTLGEACSNVFKHLLEQLQEEELER